MLLLNIRLQHKQLLGEERVRLRRIIRLHPRGADFDVDLRGAGRVGAEAAEAREQGVRIREGEDARLARLLGRGFGRGPRRLGCCSERGELLGEAARGLGVLAEDQAVREQHLAEVVAGDEALAAVIAADVAFFVVEESGIVT